MLFNPTQIAVCETACSAFPRKKSSLQGESGGSHVAQISPFFKPVAAPSPGANLYKLSVKVFASDQKSC